MADFVIRPSGSNNISAEQDKSIERLSTDSKYDVWIYGKDGTYCIVRNGKDAIASVGYICFIDGDSQKETLSKILLNFRESEIGDLKKKLIGQYVLLIKKGNNIYLFSDFMGGRNIFYSDDGMLASTSFSKIEDLIQTGPEDLDIYKVMEFLAMRHLIYPAWLGHSTEHKRIKWLLPYEYLVIDVLNSNFRLGSIVYTIDNKKQSDCELLSNELLSILRKIISRVEFKNYNVAASLTGGRDSRLVAAVAAEEFHNIHYRTSIAADTVTSLKDYKVAEKIAKIRGIPLDVYRFQHGCDEEKFRELTEGFIPSYNHSITPLIKEAGSYSLGFGGIYGTELFFPISWQSIDDFVSSRIDEAKKVLIVEDSFWKYFRESLYDEFRRIKEHYQLSCNDEKDYIRIFYTIDTARYSSFVISAFNRTGYQLEPYGSFPVLEFALRVAPELWGDHRRLGGDALVQVAAMARLNQRMARVLTFSCFRPMLPFSITSASSFLAGFVLQARYTIARRFKDRKIEQTRTDLPYGYYLSDGWASEFLRRTEIKYGLKFKQ